MQIFQDRPITTDEGDLVVLVESDEHELLAFEGATTEEVEAKLDDFLTWAS